MISYREPLRDAPCKDACPLGIDIPRYIRLIAEGKSKEALAVIREKTPFASICGYLCFRPCETNCQRGELGGPVAIKALKRFAAEGRSVPGLQKPAGKATGKSVAVIGSGPAGLTVAYYLARIGHSVTVFEAFPEPGGVMTAYIPTYRIPQAVLDAEINLVRQLGVNIKTSTRVESLDSLFKEGYIAVFVAVGAHRSQKMSLEGEDTPGIKDCLNFLRDIKVGKKVDLGTRVAVIGGGNAAVDTARTALRLGAEDVTILYRRSWNEMPANMSEVEDAMSEGVKIQFMTAPTKIKPAERGKLKIDCVRLRLGIIDASGRRSPETVPGSEFIVEVDSIISAIGQVPDIPVQFELVTGDNNTIEVTDSLATSQDGVFAGGDAVTGPASIIQAIAAGQKAAVSIDIYLGGQGVINERLIEPHKISTYRLKLPTTRRIDIPTRPVIDRIRDFNQVELTLDKKNAVAEAQRCLWCDLPIRIETDNCAGCRTCQVRCSAINFGEFNPFKSFITVTRDHAIKTTKLDFSDECINCGQCIAVCNYGALTRADKGM